MSNINAFVDRVGRIVVGEFLPESGDNILRVKEPAVVNVQVSQENGQISVQLLPFIFREFVKTEVREQGVVWKFPIDSVTVSENLELEESILKQYNNIFSAPVAEPAREKTTEPEVVKLFDE